VEVEDDYGIDLVCATSRRVGQRLHVGSGYLVQVKSDDVDRVTYEGEHVRKWLENLGSPLFVCRVEKKSTRIRLYSTWSIACVLLNLTAYEMSSPETFRLLLDERVTTDQPQADAIPLGDAIVDFRVTDLHDTTRVNELRECIEEWVRIDSENILNRHAGLAIAFGYTTWKTNEPPSRGGLWWKPYYYSQKSADDARRVVARIAPLIALTAKLGEKEALASYLTSFCDVKQIGEWERGVLGIELT
jgi:hypothetical protein